MQRLVLTFASCPYKINIFKHAGSIELDAVKFHLVHVHVFAKPNFLLHHQNCSFER